MPVISCDAMSCVAMSRIPAYAIPLRQADVLLQLRQTLSPAQALEKSLRQIRQERIFSSLSLSLLGVLNSSASSLDRSSISDLQHRLTKPDARSVGHTIGRGCDYRRGDRRCDQALRQLHHAATQSSRARSRIVTVWIVGNIAAEARGSRQEIDDIHRGSMRCRRSGIWRHDTQHSQFVETAIIRFPPD